MAAPGYVAYSGSIAITGGGGARTILMVIAGAGAHIVVPEVAIFFDGVTASNTPALVEIVLSTQATAGTSTDNAANVTPDHGFRENVASTSRRDYTVEPTVLTVARQFLVPPTSGMVWQFPLGREIDGPSSGGVGIRVSAAQTVNCRASISFEE